MNDQTEQYGDGADRLTVLSMLHEQQNNTEKSLQEHVRDCAKMQKKVLIGVALILLWVVVHSPEAAHLAAKAFPTLSIE